uniref:uncharacterized protein LOC120948080 n=1 Tax=Anopheles coluzzii TaxID=1518534 RepID=UPI0020FFB461|nr:uncharacterized protein LOC120948080 [Anopheles coluzzii]
MLNSVFGWVMIGPTSPQNPASPTDCTAASTIVCMASLEESLERFWKLEELSVNDSYSPDERRCETLYKETTQRDESGRYIVRLPKQTDFTEKLGLSKTTALRLFELLERRLERNPQLKEDYHAFMKEYLELGHMSLMNKDSGDERAYYLPYHPVFKASSTTTKVRVAFDGSAKTSTGYSLNDILCVGPIVQDELLDIVLRFRTYQIALVGDIAKMYRQILNGRFELRKWTSNNLSVLSGLSTEYIGTHSSLHFIPNETVKALGISWKPESDELCFESNTEADEATSTKRSILSSIAKMYDPLGLIAPVIVRAKMLIQELWLLKSGWDEPVPNHIYATVEFHTFTDASEAAYGACVYARCENAAGEVRISLLASKSRVAPLKRVTLPRLELSAAVLGAHLHHRVKEAMQIVCAESVFWSDSTVTLKWIASPPNSWKTFVANRVAEVQHYSHPRMVRIIAYCIRFVRNIKQKARSQRPIPHTNASKTITPEYVDAAKTVLYRIAQHDSFSAEIKQLKKGEALMKQSPLRKLTPFLDTEEVIRRSVLATGRTSLGEKHLKELARQPVGQLPPSRITPIRPFSVTGVDYAGPFYLKPAHRKAAATKSYLCVFVCFATKAVHLELVGDLTTAGFLAALRQFTSRRGLPAHIHSDNGKNFEGTERELKELFELFNDEQHRNTVATRCADRGITWHFNPPKAPHFGGLWEAVVKTAKRHLYRHLGNTRLSYEGYCTVLHQIETAMNSRPLLPLSDDPNELAALTPAHFLIGTSMFAVPEPDYTQLKSCTLDDLQKWQLLVQRFWKHWATEYLQEMQKSYASGGSNNSNILPGRLVILMDESLPTTRWPLARIVEIHPGEDKMVRVVTLKTAKGIITPDHERITELPITKICVLPLSTDSENPV